MSKYIVPHCKFDDPEVKSFRERVDKLHATATNEEHRVFLHQVQHTIMWYGGTHIAGMPYGTIPAVWLLWAISTVDDIEKEMTKLKEESAQMYKRIPLHGIGMLYEKSSMGERLEDDELEQLHSHFLKLADLLLKSGPYFRFAAKAAGEEYMKLEQTRRTRLNQKLEQIRTTPDLDKTETKGSI